MKQREKIFLGLTILVVATALLFEFVLPSGEGGDDAAGGGELSAAVKELQANYEIVQDKKTIDRKFQELPLINERAKGDSPEDIFTKDLYNMLTGQKFGVISPQMDPARFDVIPKVPDYYLIKINVEKLAGPPRQMLSLLQDLEDMGLIITRFKIDRQGDRDASQVSLDFEVARLVKHTKESKEQLSRLYQNSNVE